MELRDAQLKATLALPNGAASTTTTTPIDTGKSTALGSQSGNFEFVLTAPALTTSQLADAATMKYDIVMSDNSDLSSPTTLIATALTQTGAGGAGAAAATYRFRIPTDAKRYIGHKATNSASGNASAATATLEAVV
jgi:hypothetical protein